MNVTCQYTLTYDDYLHSHRTHQSPVKLRKVWSWKRTLVWMVLIPTMLLILGLSLIRPIRDRRGIVREYTIDLNYIVAIIPAALAGSIYWFAVLRRSTKSLRKAIFWPFILPLASGALLGLYGAYLERQKPPPLVVPETQMSTLQLVVTFASWLFSLFALWISAMWMLRNVPRAVWDSSPGLQMPVTVVASESKLRIERPDRVVEFQWRAFINYRESSQVIMLYIGENAYEVIPKRAFALRENLEAFSDLIKTAVVPAVPASTAFKPSLSAPPMVVHVQPLESREFL